VSLAVIVISTAAKRDRPRSSNKETKQMRNHFNATTGTRAWVAFILVATLGVDTAYPQQVSGSTARQSARAAATSTAVVHNPVTAVIGSDAQFTWWRDGADPFCKDDACELQKSNDNNAAMIQSMNLAEKLAWPAGMLGGGTTVTRPSAAIMNGDLTAYWHPAQADEYKQVYPGLLQFPYYPGLGNHDYANNAGTCSYGTLDNYMCAKQAVYYMANLLESGGIPNLVNKDLSGYVMFENLGAFVAKMSATYTSNGVTTTATTDSTTAGRYNSIVLPSDAQSIYVDLQYSNGSSWRSAQRYYTPYAAGGVCYSIRGALGNVSTQLEPCSKSEWPDGSYGSLSYSYDVGNYHFIQLNLEPSYAMPLPGYPLAVPYKGPFGLAAFNSPSFRVTQSWDWLQKDLAAATAAGKFSILNMHAYGDDLTDYPVHDAGMANLLTGKRVLAIFSGHLHNEFGHKGDVPVPGLPFTINGKSSVPWFRSGSAECKRFLIAEFRSGYFNVGTAVADSAGPSWVSDVNGNVCDANFKGYNEAQLDAAPKSYTLQGNFGITTQPTVTPNSGGGASVTVNGTLSDPGMDVTITMDWQDGAIDTIHVPKTSGKASFTAYHNYAKALPLEAILTADDGTLSDGARVAISTVDVKPPVTKGQQVNINTVQMLVLSATDEGSGIKQIRYMFDTDKTSTVYDKGPVPIPSGAQTAYYWSIDNADNVELRNSVSVDATPPTTTVTTSPAQSASGWFNVGTLTVTLQATDAKSAAAGTYYALDGAAEKPYTGPITVTGEGRHSLSYWSVDSLQNKEPVKTSAILIDVTAPVITVKAGVFGRSYVDFSATIAGTVIDNLSGVSPYIAGSYAIFDTWTQAQVASGPLPLTAGFSTTAYSLPAYRNYIVKVTFQDIAGNIATATTTLSGF
jgi:hypothetical protein